MRHLLHLSFFGLCIFAHFQPLASLIRHPAETFLATAAIHYGLPAITRTRLYPEIGVVEWTLSNRMRVCVHSTKTDDQEVYLQAIGPGGAFSVPSIHHASAALAVDIAIESGVGPFTGAELNAHLYDIHAELSTKVLAYAHMIEGACPTEQLPVFLSLLHALFVYPRFERSVLPSVMEREIRALSSQEADVEARFERARLMMNTRKPSVFFPLTEEALRQVNDDAAWKWYRGVFLAAQQMIVLIVGDYDLERLRALVLRFLATIPQSLHPLPLEGCGDFPAPKGVQRIKIRGHTLRESEPLVNLSYFPAPPKRPFTLRKWETVTQIMESALRTAFIKASGSTHGIDVALEFPLYPCMQPFWITLGFRSPLLSIDSLIAVANATLEELYRNGTTEKDIERALELQERNDAFWEGDKAYWIAHLASGYHFGGGPAALLPQPPPSLEEVNALLRQIQTGRMTIGILDPIND